MTLFDYYLRYMTEVWEGTRPAPEGITLPEGGDENARIQALGQQLQDMGMAAFVRACAAQDGTVLPEELFAESGDRFLLSFCHRQCQRLAHRQRQDADDGLCVHHAVAVGEVNTERLTAAKLHKAARFLQCVPNHRRFIHKKSHHFANTIYSILFFR